MNELEKIYPHEASAKSKGKVITRKPILPSIEEQNLNSRSKSAKLRIFEKGE